MANTAGMAARKECPENSLLSSPSWDCRSSLRVLLRLHRVRFIPVSKQKTGQSGPTFTACFFNDNKDFTGHTPWPGKLKMSTKSPCLDLVLLTFTWISTWSFEINFTSFHNRVSSGWEFLLVEGNNSPSLKEPKKQLCTRSRKFAYCRVTSSKKLSHVL